MGYYGRAKARHSYRPPSHMIVPIEHPQAQAASISRMDSAI